MQVPLTESPFDGRPGRCEVPPAGTRAKREEDVVEADRTLMQVKRNHLVIHLAKLELVLWEETGP